MGTAVNFSDCTFAHNQAIGGNGNSGSGPVVLVGEGIGGTIISGIRGRDLGPNTVTVSNCSLIQNSATGGDNNSGTASVAGLVGTGGGWKCNLRRRDRQR